MRTRALRHLTGALLFVLGSTLVFAHGGEDHSHEKASTPTPVIPGAPKVEASTDVVELVGVFEHGILTVYLDTFDTNMPVTQAQIDVTHDTHTATAKEVRPGVYQATLPWAEPPGLYPLSVTVEATDLLDVLEAKLDTRTRPATEAPNPSWLRRMGGGMDIAALMMFVIFVLARHYRKWVPVLLLLLVPVYSPTVMAHGDEDHGESATATPRAGNTPRRLPDGRLFVPKPTQRLLSVRTLITQQESGFRSVSLNGRVISDPNASGVVQAGQPGRFEPAKNGLPTLGEKVKAGQVLGYLSPLISSLDKGNQQASLAEIDSQLALAEKRRQRLESLVDSVPQKEIEAAQVEAQGLRKRREALSNSLYHKEPLTAPVAGVIGEMNVAAGQVVSEGTLLFSVVQPDRLWVEALSYDPTLTLQTTGAVLQVGNITAGLSLIGTATALRDQAVPLQFRIEPPVPALATGQAVTVMVRTQTSVQGISVPAESVIRNAEGQPVVWVHETAEIFRPYTVVTEPLDGNRVLITGGLEPGTRVVTGAAGSLGQIR